MTELFQTTMFGAPLTLWLAFAMLVLGILVVNMFFSQSRAHGARMRQSQALAVFILCTSLAFGMWIHAYLGASQAQVFFSVFLLEQAMSIDNIFVTTVIFNYFAVPPIHRQRVLLFAILLALVVRAAFLLLGIAMFGLLPALIWVAALFLLYIAYTLVAVTETEPDIGHNSVVRMIARWTPITRHMKGAQFFLSRKARKTGKVARYATPVFLSFMTINIADAIFALESTPAVLAVTRDPFLALTGSLLGFLSLYSLYVLISRMMTSFYYLEKALVLGLLFIVGKIAFEWFVTPVPTAITLSVIVSTLACAMLASVFRGRPVPPAKK